MAVNFIAVSDNLFFAFSFMIIPGYPGSSIGNFMPSPENITKKPSGSSGNKKPNENCQTQINKQIGFIYQEKLKNIKKGLKLYGRAAHVLFRLNGYKSQKGQL